MKQKSLVLEKISPEEKRNRENKKRCYYCGKKGNFKRKSYMWVREGVGKSAEFVAKSRPICESPVCEKKFKIQVEKSYGLNGMKRVAKRFTTMRNVEYGKNNV